MRGEERANTTAYTEALHRAGKLFRSDGTQPLERGDHVLGRTGEHRGTCVSVVLTPAREGCHHHTGKEPKHDIENQARHIKAPAEKSVEMIHVKDINKITGYIRGGCTAIGMKKDYPTVLDESANAQEKIIVSGGKNGIQIELTTEDYLKACKGKTADITLR